jgi:hypothetical protein
MPAAPSPWPGIGFGMFFPPQPATIPDISTAQTTQPAPARIILSSNM